MVKFKNKRMVTMETIKLHIVGAGFLSGNRYFLIKEGSIYQIKVVSILYYERPPKVTYFRSASPLLRLQGSYWLRKPLFTDEDRLGVQNGTEVAAL